MNIKYLKNIIAYYEDENPPDDELGLFDNMGVYIKTPTGMDDDVEVWFDPTLGLCFGKK